MTETAPAPRLAHFESFEVDLRTGELRKNGEKVKLPEQSFQVLAMLLAGPGEVVMRPEIQKRLWPNNTVVEFENSINAAVKNLRLALGDSADQPRYIETLARRGYRWLAPVNWVDANSLNPPQASVLNAEVAAPAPYLLGKKVSHYRVLEILGGGGMGVVYKAEDIKLGRRVALKFLPEEMANDPAAMERFKREARAASALNHPNICTIYSVEEHDGQPFIAMELLEGQTLRELIGLTQSTSGTETRGSALPLNKLLDIGVQIVDGLNAAHAKGIIHRDIKPANVFIPNSGQAKILDFGLAKSLEFEAPDEVPSGATQFQPGANLNLTRTGITIGTAGYMSPEQIRGETLDARTDLFSFGLVLYEMVMGQPAFKGETAAELQKEILTRTRPPVRKLNREIPLKLEQIIYKALERDRDLRYQHASDLLAELQRLKEQNESTGIERRKLWVLLAACFIVVGLAAVGTWYQRPRRAVQIDSIAVLPFTNLTGDSNSDYLSDGITESLIAGFTHLPQLKVKSRNSVFRYKGKNLDVQRIGRDLGVTALVTGRVTEHGDSVEVSAELTDLRDNTELWGQHYKSKNTDIIPLQQQIAGDIAGKLRSTLSASEKQRVIRTDTQNPEAYELYMKGRFSWNKRTLPDIAIAISYFSQALAKDPSFALAYSGLADAYSVLPGYGAAPNENYSKSNAAARKALELDPTLARPHAVLGANEIQYDWDFAGGEAEYKKAFELDPNDATAHQWYAEEIAVIGDREEEALAEITRAQQLDPLSPIVNAQRGLVLIMARRFDEAIIFCTKLANENPTLPVVHAYLAQAYWGKRMYPLVIKETKAYGQLAGNRNEVDFAFAMEQGFRFGGWKRALAKGIEARQRQRKTGYSSPYRIAQDYADLGNKDQAFLWLNTAYQERDLYLLGLKTEFLFDTLHSDPRFNELVRKVGLPQ